MTLGRRLRRSGSCALARNVICVTNRIGQWQCNRRRKPGWMNPGSCLKPAPDVLPEAFGRHRRTVNDFKRDSPERLRTAHSAFLLFNTDFRFPLSFAEQDGSLVNDQDWIAVRYSQGSIICYCNLHQIWAG